MQFAKHAAFVLCALVVGCAAEGEGGAGQTDVEFETVCGVSVPEETSTDSCKVVDSFKDGKKVQTDLNFPDFGVVLIWQPDNKVQVLSDGQDWGTPTYSTSEGETRFTIGRVTYYYISDKGLADRETGN